MHHAHAHGEDAHIHQRARAHAQPTAGTERCLHHYGAPLNAIVLFDAYRRDPLHDDHLLRVAFGGITGTLANIEARALFVVMICCYYVSE